MKTAKLLDSHLLGANKSMMVAASLAGDALSVCAVGNSRAYLIRNGQAGILSEGAGKQQLGSGNIARLIKEFAVQKPRRSPASDRWGMDSFQPLLACPECDEGSYEPARAS